MKQRKAPHRGDLQGDVQRRIRMEVEESAPQRRSTRRRAKKDGRGWEREERGSLLYRKYNNINKSINMRCLCRLVLGLPFVDMANSNFQI